LSDRFDKLGEEKEEMIRLPFERMMSRYRLSF